MVSQHLSLDGVRDLDDLGLLRLFVLDDCGSHAKNILDRLCFNDSSVVGHMVIVDRFKIAFIMCVTNFINQSFDV